MVIQNRLLAPDWSAGGEEDKAARCLKFPPSRDEDPFFKDAHEAIQVCNGVGSGSPCPMRDQCLFQSLINNESGVWGGMTHPQRKWVRRNVDQDLWDDGDYLRTVVPDPDHFNDWGDEEEEDW